MEQITVRSASHNGALLLTVVIPALALGMPPERRSVLAELIEGVAVAYDEEVARRDALASLRLVSRAAAA